MAVKKKKAAGPDLICETQPRMSDQEKDQLFVHLLRRRQFFEECLASLPLSSLHHQDDKYRILLQACHHLASITQAKPRDKEFKGLLKAEVNKIAQDFAEDDPVVEAVRDIADEGGFIDEAYAVDKADLSDDLGRTLLRRLLYEVDVVGPLDKLLADCRTSDQLPKNLPGALEKILERARKQESIDAKAVKSLEEEWDEHEVRLKHFRGRKLVGIKTGLSELDRRTLGLRGLFILGAKPGAGKTTYAAVEIALSVCRHHADNDCIVIVISLDMDRYDLYRRIHCNLGDIAWVRLMFGSPEDEQEPDSMFSKSDQKRLKRAKQRLKEEQIGKRLTILDRTVLGADVTVHRLSAIIQEQKAKVGAMRALVILDYLQLIPVPEEVAVHSDLTADKYRVRVVQEVIENTRTAQDPLGDTALVISEARKPPTAKERDQWGGSMSELMGSARLGYAADGVLLYQEMGAKEMSTHYGVKDKAGAEKRREELRDQGIAPITLILEKGRDGMIRGRWGVEFHFNKSVFRELNPKQHLLGSTPVNDEEIDEDGETTPKSQLPLPPPANGFKKVKKKKSGSTPGDKGVGKKTGSVGKKEGKKGTHTSNASKKAK